MASPSTSMLAVSVVLPVHVGQFNGLYETPPSTEYMIEPSHESDADVCPNTLPPGAQIGVV